MSIKDAAWRKATASNSSACVEVAPWVKAEASSGAGQCVEVNPAEAGVAVRDSKNPDGPALFFTWAEWDAFQDGCAKGEFTREALASVKPAGV